MSYLENIDKIPSKMLGKPLSSVLGSIDWVTGTSSDKRPYRPEVFQPAALKNLMEKPGLELLDMEMMESSKELPAEDMEFIRETINKERAVRNYESALTAI